MIRTFEKKSKKWNEVVIVNTETNDFEQFVYEIINGKLLKFSEYKTKNDAKMWLKKQCKQYKYKEVNNDFLDQYPLWNPETDLTDEIRKKYAAI
jgi:uncharacterized membrane protein YcaP (DUF421 family)